MTEQHPITPPQELVEQIRSDALDRCSNWPDYVQRVIHAAYRAGYDQRGVDIETKLQKARDEELEACCAEMREHWGNIHNTYGWELSQNLRAARRSKSPSLKEQVLKSLEGLVLPDDAFTTIRRALERLQELEGQGDG